MQTACLLRQAKFNRQHQRKGALKDGPCEIVETWQVLDWQVPKMLLQDVSSLSTLPSLQGMLPQAYMPQPRYQLGSAMSVPSLASAMSGKAPPPGGLAPRSSMPGQQGDLRSLWQQVTQQVHHGTSNLTPHLQDMCHPSKVSLSEKSRAKFPILKRFHDFFLRFE